MQTSGGEEVVASSVIIATGARANYLGLESEQRFKNAGVSACAVCDGALPRFRDKPLVVVGGGDSALEAATTIAAEPGTTVTLSYRSGAFTRAKQKNRERVDEMAAAGKLRVLLNSNVASIGEKDVAIDCGGSIETIPNDAVVISAGGILPSGFLRSVGIEVETKWGTA